VSSIKAEKHVGRLTAIGKMGAKPELGLMPIIFTGKMDLGHSERDLRLLNKNRLGTSRVHTGHGNTGKSWNIF